MPIHITEFGIGTVFNIATSAELKIPFCQKEAGTEPRTVGTFALTVTWSKHSAGSHITVLVFYAPIISLAFVKSDPGFVIKKSQVTVLTNIADPASQMNTDPYGPVSANLTAPCSPGSRRAY